MYPIQLIKNPEQKSLITEKILRKIPDWFGIEESLMEYVRGVQERPFFAAYHEAEEIGFISIKYNNQYTAEIYVTGILSEYHRQGIGTALLKKAEEQLRAENYRFLMVKTLAPSAKYEPYDRTRAYYTSVGFYPLEEIVEIWDKDNPCLIMVKNI
jgi:GNAT superfamily N-acetyltransferase